MSRTTLVTGATGFVGGHLLDRLAGTGPVVAWYRPEGRPPDLGRDVDWLNRNGYPCSGIDASGALVDAARRLFPAWRFEQGSLPELAHVPAESYCNVVCETVIMPSSVPKSVPSLRTDTTTPSRSFSCSWSNGVSVQSRGW